MWLIGFVVVVIEHPEVQRKGAFLSRVFLTDTGVVTDVESDVIVVDGIYNGPGIGRFSGAIRSLLISVFRSTQRRRLSPEW